MRRRRTDWTGRVAVGALLFVAPAAAAQTAPLTLDQAVRDALARHPSLEVAAAAVERAAGASSEARAARRPSLGADLSLMRFAEPMVVAPLHGFDPRLPPAFDRTLVQGGLTLAYTLYDGGAGAARVERAGALGRAAAAGLEGAHQTLIGEVVRAYLQVGAARELVSAHRRRADAVEQERARVGRLLEQGKAARVSLLRAEAARSAARADEVAARVELEVAERALARLLGAEPERVAAARLEALRTADGEPLPERAELVRRAVAAHPDMERRRAQLEAALEAADEARALWRPRVLASGRYTEYGTDERRHQGEWQGGVQVSYPLFTGGARGAAAERARADAGTARAELALGELRMAEAVDRALAALETARARRAALQAAEAQSAEVARIEKLALDTGAGVQTDYLAAEAELLRVRAALTGARAAELGARVELARITGELTPEWLAQHLEGES